MKLSLATRVTATVLLSALGIAPAFAGVGVPAALVIHGNDRTLAAVPSPGGPPQLNLAPLGVFPNDLVVRGSLGYAVCSGAGVIDVIDIPSCTVIGTIDCGAGSNPWGIAFTSDTRAYVSRLYTNDVLAIDLPAGTIAATIPVGRSPEGLVVAAGRVFVANTGFSFSTYTYDPGTVSVIDPATNSVTATLPVGLNPQSLAVAPNGEVHALCSGDYFSVFGRAFVLNPAGPAVVDSLDLGASPGILAIDGAGHAYASDYFAGVLKYDAPTRTVLRGPADPIAVGTGAAGIAFGGGRTWVCVYGDDHVVTLDAADNLVDTFNVGDGPQDVAFYTPEPPTAITLTAFAGSADAGGVALEWRTAADPGLAGFHVERAAAADGPWQRLTAAPIPASAGGRYRWRDDGSADAAGATLWYRLVAVDRAGHLELLAPLAVQPDLAGPKFRLLAPAPNPVRAAGTTLSFKLAAPGRASLALFDAAGREVARPLDQDLDAGTHSFSWSAQDGSGRRLAAGAYFLRLTASGRTDTCRLLITR